MVVYMNNGRNVDYTRPDCWVILQIFPRPQDIWSITYQHFERMINSTCIRLACTLKCNTSGNNNINVIIDSVSFHHSIYYGSYASTCTKLYSITQYFENKIISYHYQFSNCECWCVGVNYMNRQQELRNNANLYHEALLNIIVKFSQIPLSHETKG